MFRSFLLVYVVIWLYPHFLGAKQIIAPKRPNIVVIVSDEEAYTPYGWEVINEWAKKNLPNRTYLKDNGVDFHQHYVGATACGPSRGVLYTGQFPGVTNLTQTNGFAKILNDPDMTWLQPKDVPNIAQWLLAAGFPKEKLVYIGKWHLSEVDLLDSMGRVKQTLTLTKKPIEQNIFEYMQKKVLEPFGFLYPWIGPEPHGAGIENSGEYVDPVLVAQTKEYMKIQAEQKNKGEDWQSLLFVNLLQPHDIALAWAFYLIGKLDIDKDSPVPPICEETDYLDLSQEPKVHTDYVYTYKKMYCWAWMMKQFYDGDKNRAKIRQFYYDLIKKSDNSLGEIIDELKALGLDDETIFIFTSDHGDLLGRRGGQQQKWHSLHKEVVHVPLIIAGPGIEKASIDQFTSHVDIVPTLLGLLNIDVEETRQKLLTQGFRKVPPLRGINLSELIYGKKEQDYSRVVYMRTEDDISNGSNRYAATWFNTLPSWLLRFVPFGTFDPIKGSRYVESIRLYDDMILGRKNEWSFMRYWDPDGKTPDTYRLYRVTDDGFEVDDFSTRRPKRVERYKATMEFLREYYQNPQ